MKSEEKDLLRLYAERDEKAIGETKRSYEHACFHLYRCPDTDGDRDTQEPVITLYAATDKLCQFHDHTIIKEEAKNVSSVPQLTREEVHAKMEAVLLEELGSFDGYEKEFETWCECEGGLYAGSMKYVRKIGNHTTTEYADVSMTGYGTIEFLSFSDIGIFDKISSISVNEENLKAEIEKAALKEISKDSANTFDPDTDHLSCGAAEGETQYYFGSALYSPDGGVLKIPYRVGADVIRTNPDGSKREVAHYTFTYMYTPDEIVYK